MSLTSGWYPYIQDSWESCLWRKHQYPEPTIGLVLLFVITFIFQELTVHHFGTT